MSASTEVLRLPTAAGGLEPYRLSEPRGYPQRNPNQEALPRIAYAAAHVVTNPLANADPWQDCVIDWDATLAYRRYLWGLGLGVAEAMDTAQRGMGLHWGQALELIRRSVVESNADGKGELLACGAGTDHLAPGSASTLADVIEAYTQQCAAVEAVGGRIILMASRALAACAQGPDDYAEVYQYILSQVREPVIIHWLGEMFDPALSGYWGSGDHNAAMDTCLGVISAHAEKVDGIKISLLNPEKEVEMRRRLPAGVKMYTGDDFNYPQLIAGDELGYSHALLGIFDAIAPAAAAALTALGQEDREAYDSLLAPTVPLSRHIFMNPTRFYKTGVVFMAYLNGHQGHFTMLGGQQSARSLVHLCELFRLADQAGLLRQPDLAAVRMRSVLAVHGVAG